MNRKIIMASSKSSSRETARAAPSLQRATRLQSQKRVRFSKNLISIKAFECAALDLNEKETLWYTADDIQRQRDFDRHMLHVILEGTSQFRASPEILIQIIGKLGTQANRNDAAWDIRGLEHLIDGCTLRDQERFKSHFAVFSAQSSFTDTDKKCDAACRKISILYHNRAEASVLAARRRAAMDQSFVENDVFQELHSKQQVSHTASMEMPSMFASASPCAA
jgi:hypothetical protein